MGEYDKKNILVIVPFPMSDENRAARQEQLKAVKLSADVKFVFRSVKAAWNYVSAADMVLADIGILEVASMLKKKGFQLSVLIQ